MHKFLDGSAGARKTVATIIARAWRDAAYRRELIEDPRAVFAAAGVVVPPEVPISVTVDTPQQRHVLLDAGPAPAAARPPAEAPDFRSVSAYVDARARADAEFRAALLADPTGIFRGLGCALPPDATVVVHVDSPDRAYFNLPLPPVADDAAEKPGHGGGEPAELYMTIPASHAAAKQPDGEPAELYMPIPLPQVAAKQPDDGEPAELYMPIPLPQVAVKQTDDGEPTGQQIWIPLPQAEPKQPEDGGDPQVALYMTIPAAAGEPEKPGDGGGEPAALYFAVPLAPEDPKKPDDGGGEPAALYYTVQATPEDPKKPDDGGAEPAALYFTVQATPGESEPGGDPGVEGGPGDEA